MIKAKGTKMKEIYIEGYKDGFLAACKYMMEYLSGFETIIEEAIKEIK